MKTAIPLVFSRMLRLVLVGAPNSLGKVCNQIARQVGS